MPRMYRKYAQDSSSLRMGLEQVSHFFQRFTGSVQRSVHTFQKKHPVSFKRLITFIGGAITITVGLLIAFTILSTKTEAVWYNTSWAYRVPLTIKHTQVDADLTDFPVYVSLADLPLPFHQGVKSDGCDIRVTKSDQVTEVPFELVVYTAASDTGELHFKADSLANSTDTVFYIYYGNPSASCYAENATYGAQNVWTNSYKAVYHLQQDPSGTTLDSTSNNFDMTSTGSMSSSNNVAGALAGSAVSFDGVDDILSDSDQTWSNTDNEITMQYWEYVATADVRNGQVLYYNPSGNERALTHSPWSDNIIYWDFGTCCVDGRISGSYTAYNNKWTFVHTTSNGSTRKRIFLDGVKTYFNDAAADNPNVDLTNLRISTTFKGNIDEVRIATVERDPTWISTEFNNHQYSSTFYTAGEQEDRETNEPAPAGYWKFDEGYGTTTNDSSSANKDGTITGAIWRTPDLCVANNCLYFDGTNDIVNVDTAAMIDVTSSYSISAWIRPNSISGERAIFAMGNTANNTQGFYFSVLDGYINYNMCNNSDVCFGNSGGAITSNSWHYVVLTKSGSNYTLYVNGVASTTTGSTSGSYTFNTSTIGAADRLTNDRFFQGDIDEVKIYPYARTADQVKTDYISRGGLSGTSAAFGASANQVNQWLTQGLAGYWKMDEASGNRSDSSGNGSILTDTNTVTTNPGKYGSSGQFTIANTEYLTAADNPILSTGDIDFTLSTWVYIDSLATANDQTIISKENAFGGGTTAEYRLSFLTSSDKFNFLLFDSSHNTIGSVTDATTLSASTWYHVIAWHDATSNTVSIQVNAGNVVTAATSGSPSDTTASFFIGARGGPNDVYGGRIDDTRFYKRMLNPTERMQLYVWAPGPYGYWSMNENTDDSCNGTADACDISGNGNHGTKTSASATTWIPGKYGGAARFDGSANEITLSDSPFDFERTDPFTITAWVRTTKQNGSIILTKNDGSNTGITLFYEDTTGYPRLWIESTSTNRIRVDGNIGIADGNWHHIAATYDGSSSGSGVKLYTDGILNTTTIDESTLTTSILNNNNMKFGCANSCVVSDTWSGDLDEIKIYTYVRSLGQIIEDMNGGHPLGGSPISSMANYWNFDEQQGQTLNNKGLNATMSGSLGKSHSVHTDDPSWKTAHTSSCKINGCLSFDGGDFVALGVNRVVPETASFTISAWIYSASATVQSIFSQNNLTDSDQLWDFNVDFQTNNQIYFRARDMAGGNTVQPAARFNTINLSTWNHVAVTYNGTDEFRFYTNGVLVGVVPGTIAGTFTTNTVSIGRINQAGSEGSFFNGSIDEVKTYNAALTADEINIDMNAGSAIATGGVLGTQDNEGFGNLIPTAWWKLDENTGTSVADYSANGYSGSVTNATWTPGKIGQALRFDGSSAYVDVATSGISIPNNQDFSISAWVNVDSSKTGITTNFFGGCNDPTGGATCAGSDYDGILLRKDTLDKLWLSVYFFRSGAGSCSFITANSLPLNQWTHVAATFDENDASSVGTLYINGVSQILGTSSCSGVTSATTTLYPAIGAGKVSNNGASSAFTSHQGGLIDNVKFYLQTLTNAQIAYDYNRGAPVLMYAFDECTSNTAYNTAPTASQSASILNGNIVIGGTGSNTSVGSCDSGTSTHAWNNGTAGKRNYSIDLDGTDDYVQTVNAEFLNFRNLDDLSIAFWAKCSADEDGFLVIKRNGGNSQGYNVYLGSGSLLRFQIGDGTNTVTSTPGITDVCDGTWHHIVMTVDRTNDVGRLYIDGRQEGTDILISTVTGSLLTTNHFQIGREDNNTAFFDGQIDDVRLYRYVLSLENIRKIMNYSTTFFGPNEGEP